MRFHGVDIIARGLTARGARGCAFAGVSLDIEAGRLAVITGPGGSGRTSLLLALAGRMRIVAGSAAVGGWRLPDDARRVREVVGVARAEPAVGLDDELRVGDLVQERMLIAPGVDGAAVADAMALLEVDAPGRTAVADLPPDQRTLLAVALTAAEGPGVVVVDDTTRGCDPAGSDRVWTGLRALGEHGCTVLASTAEALPALDDSITVIELPHPTERDRIPLPEE
ncbi:ATP-binding cassette domain-containing protein [Nocardia veterana]|uniref:ATP-binding cassette domain-containing protein n=1 Tax=Nocardia veterana TaxID=132249 RepID=A0A7X6LZA9_9NOCA|nr:ATP-binding cassette domain-containing protein [Nocardia veterana]NKY87318.1 ATP-binding cassette domain-containing protein [Nocardia veterana]